MKKKMISLLLGGLILLPVACNTLEQEETLPQGETVFCGFASPGPDTRMVIGDPYGSPVKYDALWEAGDAVKVYKTSDSAHLGDATLTEGEDTNTGKFTLGATVGDASVRLIYPQTANYAGPHTLAEHQTQAEAGKRNISAYTFAYSEVTGAASDYNFTLSHVPAFMKIAIKANTTSDPFYGWKVNAVTLRVPGHVLSGDFFYDYESEALTEGKSVYDYVTVELDTPFSIGTTPQEVWLSALPGDLTGSLVLVTLHLSSGGTQKDALVKFTGRPLLSGSVNAMGISNLTSLIEPGTTTGSEYSNVTVQSRSNKTAAWSGYETRLVSGMNRMDKFLVDTRDAWGGYKGVAPEHITSTNPAGFWRTGTYHGRPMFVDPAGNISFLYGMNCVLPDPLSDAAATQTTKYYNDAFANEEEWADWSAGNLANIGFNLYSNNPRRFRTYRTDISKAAETRLRQGNNKAALSQVENLYLLRTFLWDYNARTGKTFSTEIASPFVIMWDPDWTDFCYKTALFAAGFFKADPNFIGYFTDNELPFVDTNNTYKKGISLQGWLNLEEDPAEEYGCRCNPYAKAWAQNWMQENYGTTTYNVSMEPEFLRAVCEYYYRTTAEAIRAADPSHLVLGTRLHQTSKASQAIVESCARYHDVVSMNFYDYWDVTAFAEIQYIKGWVAGKPVMATEFYVKNENQTVPGSGTAYNNNEGAGWLVQNQTARGRFYQNNVIRFIEEGTFAGWMWFKWTDDYRSTIPGWVNKGLVVPDYSGLYTDCTSLMKTAHWNLYQLLDYYWGAPAGGDDLAGDIPEGTWDYI